MRQIPELQTEAVILTWKEQGESTENLKWVVTRLAPTDSRASPHNEAGACYANCGVYIQVRNQELESKLEFVCVK